MIFSVMVDDMAPDEMRAMRKDSFQKPVPAKAQLLGLCDLCAKKVEV